jgi:hypothetical protein
VHVKCTPWHQFWYAENERQKCVLNFSSAAKLNPVMYLAQQATLGLAPLLRPSSRSAHASDQGSHHPALPPTSVWSMHHQHSQGFTEHRLGSTSQLTIRDRPHAPSVHPVRTFRIPRGPSTPLDWAPCRYDPATTSTSDSPPTLTLHHRLQLHPVIPQPALKLYTNSRRCPT